MSPKASDQTVAARTILTCVSRLQRQGAAAAMKELEAVEPDLAEYVFEAFSTTYQNLLALGGTHQKTRRAYRQVETLTLVCIQTLRQGHYELWRQSEVGQQLDPADSETGD